MGFVSISGGDVNPRPPYNPGGGGGGSFSNEPVGYTLIQDQPWNPPAPQASPLQDSLGWNQQDALDDYKVTVQTDGTAPYSPSNVLRGEFHIGDPGGSGPFKLQKAFDSGDQYSNLFMGVFLKHSAGFDNTNGNTGTKFLWPGGSVVDDPHTYNGHDEANMEFNFFQQASGGVGPDRRLSPNLDAPAATLLSRRGSWVKYEMLVKANSSNGTANGECHTWIDGVKVMQYTDVDWYMLGARKWLSITWNPIYGGGLNPVPFTQYQYMDHIRMSGSN